MAPLQTNNLRVDSKPEGVRLLWLNVAGRSVNIFTRAVMADLDKAIDDVAADDTARLFVLRSEKNTGFVAGADLHEFTSIHTAEDAQALAALGQRIFGKLAGLRVPTIALIHGPCLGGGLELALACDYRLVLDHPKTQLGFPEVELGLLPAWGGCQRLPRVVGLERALKVILAGYRLDAREAQRWGLADALGATEPELAARLGLLMVNALRQGKRAGRGLPLRTWRQRFLELTPLTRRMLYRVTERHLQRVPDDMPAPFEAFRAVQIGLKQGMEAGFAAEREAAGRLVTSRACRNLVGLFLQREEARKLPEKLAGGSGLPIKRVAVIGAGTMGAGIAQLAAIRGCEVIVHEVNSTALAVGMENIKALFQKAVQNHILARDAAVQKLAALKGTTTWDGVGTVDLVVEAVIEDLSIKQNVFRELEERTNSSTLLCTNTSSLPVVQIQQGLRHPERLAGLHFFNPVHKMPLVEVIHAPGTAEGTIADVCRWAVALGKTAVVVKDSPGFVVNRILMPYLAEAVLLASQGVAATTLDRTMRRFGMPMGPLELLDQVGIDVATNIARAMEPVFAERWRSEPGLQRLAQTFDQMRQKGWLGQKTGLGFYQYNGKKKVHHEALHMLCSSPGQVAASSIGNLAKAMQVTQARERLVLLMVNEAAACLGEGLAEGARAIDLAMVLGTGWAPHRGGPLRYAEDRGRAEVVQALEAFAAILGPQFAPCPALKQPAEKNALETQP